MAKLTRFKSIRLLCQLPCHLQNLSTILDSQSSPKYARPLSCTSTWVEGGVECRCTYTNTNTTCTLNHRPPALNLKP